MEVKLIDFASPGGLVLVIPCKHEVRSLRPKPVSKAAINPDRNEVSRSVETVHQFLTYQSPNIVVVMKYSEPVFQVAKPMS